MNSFHNYTYTLRQSQFWQKVIYQFCLFVVRHKFVHSCESAIFFNLDKGIIKHNCDVIFYYNKTDITLTVLDGGNEIILANWPNDKHIICTINNDILIEIPSHPYIW